MCFPLKFFSSRNKVGIYQFLRPNKKRTLPRSNPIADKTNGTRTITSWFWRWNHVFALKNKTKRPLLFTQKRSQAFFGGFWQPQKFPPKTIDTSIGVIDFGDPSNRPYWARKELKSQRVRWWPSPNLDPFVGFHSDFLRKRCNDGGGFSWV